VGQAVVAPETEFIDAQFLVVRGLPCRAFCLILISTATY